MVSMFDAVACALAHNGLLQMKAMCACAQWLIADESLVHSCTRLSMLDSLARACLCLTLPGRLVRLTSSSSSPSRNMMRICFLVHKASPSDTRHLLLPIDVVVVIAAGRHDIKMPGARTRGLVDDICCHHCCCCCCRHCCTMRYENAGRSCPRPCC